MSAPSSMRMRRTFCPSGPVWWVFNCMPRIAPACWRTSSRDFATLTPPPLPRPPAWICALTTHTLPPRRLAASSASSTENAGKPRGVGMPYLRKISLPWYSWIFIMLFFFAVFLLAVPLGIPAAHRLAGAVERMALVELERLGPLRVFLLHLPGEGLDRGGRDPGEHLGKVRATAHAAEQRFHRPAEILQQIQADQLAVCRRDGLAAARIGHHL